MEVSSFSAWTETILGGISILRGVPSETLLELGRRAEWRRHAVGERLMGVDGPSDTFFFLTAGNVAVRMANNGRHDYGAGACIGLRRAYVQEYVPLTAMALSPVTAGWMHKDDFADVAAHCAELGRAFGEALAQRVRDPLAALDDGHDLDDRVAQGLIVAAGAERRDDGIAVLTVLPTPSVWAALLGVATEDVQRSLARLESRGFVRTVAQERMYVNVERLRARLERRRASRGAASD
jgi:CRP-like cAMP-binding protein